MFAVLTRIFSEGMAVVLLSAQAFNYRCKQSHKAFGDCPSFHSSNLCSNPSWSLRGWRKSWWTRRSNWQSVLMWYHRTMGTRFTLPWRLRRTMSTLSLRLFASVFLAVILELTSLERSNSRNAYVRWVLRDGPVTTSFQFFVEQDLGDRHLSSNLVCCSPLPRESVGVYQSMRRILILCASCSAISHST